MAEFLSSLEPFQTISLQPFRQIPLYLDQNGVQILPPSFQTGSLGTVIYEYGHEGKSLRYKQKQSPLTSQVIDGVEFDMCNKMIMPNGLPFNITQELNLSRITNGVKKLGTKNQVDLTVELNERRARLISMSAQQGIMTNTPYWMVTITDHDILDTWSLEAIGVPQNFRFDTSKDNSQLIGELSAKGIDISVNGVDFIAGFTDRHSNKMEFKMGLLPKSADELPVQIQDVMSCILNPNGHTKLILPLEVKIT